jgi:hypothetical protein
MKTRVSPMAPAPGGPMIPYAPRPVPFSRLMKECAGLYSVNLTSQAGSAGPDLQAPNQV